MKFLGFLVIAGCKLGGDRGDGRDQDSGFVAGCGHKGRRGCLGGW